jgi:hypothetical protein
MPFNLREGQTDGDSNKNKDMTGAVKPRVAEV